MLDSKKNEWLTARLNLSGQLLQQSNDLDDKTISLILKLTEFELNLRGLQKYICLAFSRQEFVLLCPTLAKLRGHCL